MSEAPPVEKKKKDYSYLAANRAKSFTPEANAKRIQTKALDRARKHSTALYTANDLTVEDLKNSLPKHIRDYTRDDVYERVVEQLNGDIELRNQLGQVVKIIDPEDGVRLDELMQATTFVHMKLSGCDNMEAWKVACPVQYERTFNLAERVTENLKRRSQAFANSKLVVRLMEHSVIPAWIRNHHVYQEAVEVQLDLMKNARSETVKQKAADSLMTHLAKPNDKVPQVQVNVENGSGLTAIQEMLESLGNQQVKSIIEGTSVKDITDVEIS